MTITNRLSQSLLITIIASTCIYAITGNQANAQISSRVVNISPVSSDRDGSNPNSASGGRVNQLATHPTSDDIFFAASEWGGLHRTIDAGRNWTYVPGHRPQVMWDVKISPANANIMVATSFFDGKTDSLSGINVSRDAGVTWSVPATARPDAADCTTAARQAERQAFGIAFDPANASLIYVGTNCGLAISNDAGVSWDFVDPTPGDGGGLNVWDVIVHNGGTIDICGDDGHQRSTDGGVTFVAGAAEAGGTCSLAVSPDEANVLFMSVGTQIFESRNAGASWPTTFVNPASQGRIPFVKVNDRTGRAFDLWFGDTQLFRAACTTPVNTTSTTRRCPASNSWTNSQTGSHWDVGDITFDTDLTVDACPILFSNDGGVYFNQRSGSNCQSPRWEQPTQSVTALWLWDMDGNFRTDLGEEGLYMGQQDSGAFGTRDGGATNPGWISPGCCDVFDVEAENNRVVYTLCCINSPPGAPPVPRTQMFLDGDNMNGGSAISAASRPPGTMASFRDMDALSNYAADSYAIVTSTGVFFTTNIGAGTITWQNLGTAAPANICGIYSSTRNDGTPVFTARVGGCGLGGVGGLWQHVGATTTGNWVQIQRAGQNQFGAFGVNPADPNHIIANDMSGATPTMVRTTDGGTNWTVLGNLDTMLTGNNDFLLQVQTGTRPGDNAYTQASLVAINPQNRNMIVAGGQTSGLFLSVDGGNDWKLLTDPRTNNVARPHISRPLFAHFEPLGAARTNLYVGARGRGAWRITIDVENRWAGSIWRHTGTACSGDSCPGWRKYDNNVRTVDIAAGSDNNLYQLHFDGTIWRSNGTACSGDNCPGWQKLDNNPKTLAIAAGGNSLYQLHNDGGIWRFTGTPCTGDSCPGWTRLDNNRSTIAIEASGNNLYQLHRDGKIWKSTGAACSGDSCPGWRMLDNNSRTIKIYASDGALFQQHEDGRIWRHTGTACSGQSCPGWVMLDNNPRTVDLGVNDGKLFQRHRDGTIWRSNNAACSGSSCPGWVRLDNNPRSTAINGSVYQNHHDGRIWKSTGAVCSGESCPGWQMLDNNPRTKFSLASDSNNNRLYQLHAPKLFQLHNNGAIWQSTGQPCQGDSCPGWQRLDNNGRTEKITASGGRLFQMHEDGKIWRSTGRPCVDDTCPGWQMIDNNPRTREIVSGGGQLYQLHDNGSIWRFVGRSCSEASCPGWVKVDKNPNTVEIVAAAGQLYQRHRNGRIWRFTGRDCQGNSCPGWVMLDKNRRTTKIVAAGGLLHQLHNNGKIWTHTGQACSGNSCPGWRMMDNNSRTVDIVGGGRELYQLHNNGQIWESTGVPCSGSSCPGWRRLDNNQRTQKLTAAGGNLYQLHNNGAIWRSDGRSCSGNSCPGWVRLDNNARTVAIEAAHE